MKMQALETAKNAVTKLVGRTGLKIKAKSPELLMAAGGIAIVGGVILACKETLVVDEILDEHATKQNTIHEVLENEDHPEYDEKAASHDILVLRAKTGVALVKNYAPAAGCIIFGFGCFLTAHKIMKSRNLALMAAYKAVDTAFKDYRSRVLEEMGDIWDKHFMYGTETKEEQCGCGKVKQVPKTEDENPTVDPLKPSIYARWFDESSVYWKKDATLNKTFLICQQNYANDLLRARGHVFLNDVYRMLGMPDTKAGSVVGWVLGNGNDYVDFGLYNAKRAGTVDFMEGFERSVLLDFNVDGVIYDLI